MTKAGDLECDHVIHARPPNYRIMIPWKAHRYLRELLINILDLAYNIGIKSVAMPALGSGYMGMPKLECAE